MSGWKTIFTGLSKYRADGVTPCEYKISEVNVPGYESFVEYMTDSDVVITNTFVDVGSLYISKTLKDFDKVQLVEGLADTEFVFDILVEHDGELLNGIFALDGDVGTEKGSIVFDEGKAVVKLKHGESLCIKNLPSGYEYKVSERDVDGFAVDGKSSVSGVLKANGQEKAEFVNKLDESIPVPLPETGGSGVIPMLSIGFVFIVVGGLYLYRRVRRNAV